MKEHGTFDPEKLDRELSKLSTENLTLFLDIVIAISQGKTPPPINREEAQEISACIDGARIKEIKHGGTYGETDTYFQEASF